MKITIQFAGNNIGPVTVSEGATVDSVVKNPNIATVLGYDAGNVEAFVGGTAFNGTLRDGDTVVLQQKAHRKAA